jgi:cytochrome P450
MLVRTMPHMFRTLALNGQLGPGVCVGRALAQHEMRAVLAAFVHGYDVQFAPKYDPKRWLAGLEDRYILARSQLKVVLSRRQ